MDEISCEIPEELIKFSQYIEPALEREVTEEDYALLALLLDFAKDKILAQGYPFGNYPDKLPARYQSLQIRIAAELYNHIGANGQTSYTNNGITRVWESSDVAQSLLNEVVPRVGVIGDV